MIEADLQTQLSAFPALKSLIQSRIYPKPPAGVPQSAPLPALTYERISSIPTYTSEKRVPLRVTRFQFCCYGRTTLEAMTLVQALTSALDGFSGARRAYIDNVRYQSDPDTKVVYPCLDARFWHQE